MNSIGIRGGVTGSSPIGEKEEEYFHQYDLMANWSLPWGWYSESGWGVVTRLMGSVGAVTASGDAVFVSTVLPGIVLGKKDGWLSLEFGAGGAIFSQQRFAHQNVGGLFQLVADMAIRAKVYGGLGVGYWFHHMSDAGLLWKGCPWNRFSYDRGQLPVLTVFLQNALSRPSVFPTGFLITCIAHFARQDLCHLARIIHERFCGNRGFGNQDLLRYSFFAPRS